MKHALPFLVLTLLQLCRAEIQNALPEWYAANLINDANYSPKPLTEIFSTDASLFSKLTESTQTTTQITSTNTPQTSTSTTAPSTNPTTEVYRDPQTQATPQLMNLTRPQSPPALSQVTQTIQPQGAAQWPAFAPVMNWPQLPSSAPASTATATPGITPTPAMAISDQPNSPTISTVGSSSLIPQTSTVWYQNPTGTIPTTQTRNTQGFQPYLPMSPAQPGTPVVVPSDLNPSGPCNRRIITTPQVTIENTPTPTATSVTQTSSIPTKASPIITISVKGRKGSKTNILVNSSTRTPVVTTRKRKNTRNNNNYNVCVDSCKNRKEPICASPKGVTPVNVDNLKGFASMCHMACHNSYRNQTYDKVADGRCGKLRTRIRPVDQNKLNRNDLNKAAYDIVHDGGETVLEVLQLAL